MWSVLDNLQNGAAGQAVQNMNLICGFSEKTGLDFRRCILSPDFSSVVVARRRRRRPGKLATEAAAVVL